MTLAFLLIATKVGNERNVVEKLLELEEVVEANILFGEWDVIARIKTANNRDMQTFIIEKIRILTGVTQTSALIAADTI